MTEFNTPCRPEFTLLEIIVGTVLLLSMRVHGLTRREA